MEVGTETQLEAPKTSAPEIADGKFSAIVGYFGFLCFIPLLLKRNNSFAQFHGRQALVLFIFELVAWIVTAVPVVGNWVFASLCLVLGLFSLVGMIKAARSEHWPVPIIHHIADQLVI